MAVSDEQQPQPLQPPQDFSAFEGTRPVNERLRFDADALGAWLASHVDGFEGPLEHRAVRGRPVESDLQADHARTQLRDALEARPGGEAAAVGACDRARVSRDGCARGTDVPVAKMFALCEDESVIGRAFYVMEFIEGRVLWDQSLPGMTPAERGAIYDEMNRVIAALHSRRCRARSASPTTASRATTSSARSGAGASSMSRPKPSRSKR